MLLAEVLQCSFLEKATTHFHILPRVGIGDRIDGAAVPDSKQKSPCGFDVAKTITSMGAE